MVDLNEFIRWLIKLNSLKKVRDASLQNLSIVSTFISRCGVRSTLIENQMSYLMAYQAKLIKKRFVMRLCRTFPLYPHSYQDVVIDLKVHLEGG